MLKAAALQELIKRTSWAVCHDEDRTIGTKLFRSKSPFRADRPTVPASSTKPETWGTYSQALQAVVKGKASGIGYMLSDDDPYVMFDFDNCVDDDGNIEPSIFEEIKALSTYSEYSLSGKGVHCVGYGSLPDGARHKGNGVEAYDRDRFFIFTGKRIRGTKLKINQVDPSRILLKIRGDVTNSANGKLGEPSRHDEVLVFCFDCARRGLSRAEAEPAAFAKARIIGLPDREGDGLEVKRMLDAAYGKASWERRLADEVDKQKLRREAKVIFETELLGDQRDPLDDTSAADELALPDVEDIYAIDQLWTADGNATLFAERKIGKTSLGLTVARSLVDNEPFLDHYAVTVPEGRKVCYLNYELTQNMFRRWIRRMNLKHPERLMIRTLKGHSLPFWLPDVRARFIEYLKRNDVWCIIIDPLMMAAQGMVDNENDNVQWAGFQHVIEEIKVQANVDATFIIHHIGKADKNRGRGGSQIEAWPEQLWYMRRNEETGERTLSAEGRLDRPFLPIELSFDEQTYMYHWEGVSATEAALEQRFKTWCKALLAYHREHKFWPYGGVARNMVPQNDHRKEFMDDADGRGYILRPGYVPNKKKRYRVQLTEKGMGITND